MKDLICAKPVSNVPVCSVDVAVVGIARDMVVGFLGEAGRGVRRDGGVGSVGEEWVVNGSIYAFVVVVVGFSAGTENTTGAVVGFAIRGPEGRSHGQRVVKVRFGLVFFALSAIFARAFSNAFSRSLLSGGAAPSTVPVRSLVLYPKMESPSTELEAVKLGIDFTGLGEREVRVDEVSGGRL